MAQLVEGLRVDPVVDVVAGESEVLVLPGGGEEEAQEAGETAVFVEVGQGGRELVE